MRPNYRFQIYMEDMSHDAEFANLVSYYFGYATIRTGNLGIWMDELERSAVLEYVTSNAVEGEGTCQRFSEAFCKQYNQECTMITMDRIHMRMSKDPQ